MQFMSTFFQECSKYSALYHLSDEFVWFCMGAMWYTQGASSAEIPDLLDSLRTEYSNVKDSVVV